MYADHPHFKLCIDTQFSEAAKLLSFLYIWYDSPQESNLALIHWIDLCDVYYVSA